MNNQELHDLHAARRRATDTSLRAVYCKIIADESDARRARNLAMGAYFEGSSVRKVVMDEINAAHELNVELTVWAKY